jgi:hypothetical protein
MNDVTKMFISKTTLSVIPACLESFLKKDAGQASMTEYLNLCDHIYGFISNYSKIVFKGA